MKLDERYLREWGLGMFSLGYLDFDKVSRKMSLNKEFIPVLVEEGGKFSQKGLIEILNSSLLPYHELLDSFKIYSLYVKGIHTIQPKSLYLCHN